MEDPPSRASRRILQTPPQDRADGGTENQSMAPDQWPQKAQKSDGD
jgi:hypothetical protein